MRSWTVEDGTIHGQGVTKEYGYLRTEKKYKDFWLSIRFKCEDDGNSGVYFHTEFKGDTVDSVKSGMQFEIDRTIDHHNGGLYGDGRGWIAWPSPEYEQVIRPTDWNEFLLKVESNHMVCVLNGITILDFTDPTPKSFDGYDCAAIALRRHRQHALQGYLHSRHVGAVSLPAGLPALRGRRFGGAAEGFARCLPGGSPA